MLPDAWIEKIFQRPEDYYGARWAAHYGDFPRERVKRTWAEELDGFIDKPECISKALKAQLDCPFPPTLPQFLELCREQAKRIPPVQLGLPSPPVVEPAVARERIAKIIQSLGDKWGKRA